MLSQNNILELVLVLVVSVNGQNKVSVSKVSTANMVDSLRQQLMENNYDYVESREGPPPAARARAGFAQSDLSLRIHRVTNARPHTHTPMEPPDLEDIVHWPPETPRYEPARSDRTSQPTSTASSFYNEAGLEYQHEWRSDFEELPLNNEYPERQQTTKTRVKYQKQRVKPYLPLLNTDSRYQEFQDTEIQTYQPIKNVKYTRKKPSVIRRQPYPEIDVQYKVPSVENLYVRPKTSRTQTAVRPEYNHPPNIRFKHTLPAQTGAPLRLPLQRHIKIRKKAQSTHTTRKPKSHSHKLIPDSLWEEDHGPFEAEHSHPTPADLPLANKYHFRADDDVTSTSDNSRRLNNPTVKYSYIRLKRGGHRRRGGAASYRNVIKEESPDGLTLLVLDHEPLPEFKLPAPWRQYMVGSHSHENLHELL